MGRNDVDNQQAVDCASGTPDDLTKQLYCGEAYEAVVSEVGIWHCRVVDEMMEKSRQYGDVNRSEHDIDQDTESGLYVSRSISILSDKNNVQIVKPLTVQEICRVINNVTDIARGPEKEYVKLVELKSICEEYDDTQYDDPEFSQCVSDQAQLLQTVSHCWVAKAISNELQEFTADEVHYTRPYEGRSFVVDQTLIGRSADHAWRGQSIIRFGSAEIYQRRATEGEDYLREVLTCKCGLELEATRAAFHAADPQLQIKNGSACELIYRLNAHEHRRLVGSGLITGSAVLSLGDKTQLAPVRPLPPVETAQPVVIEDDLSQFNLPRSDVGNNISMVEDVNAEKLAEDTTDNGAESVKRWPAPMNVVEQEFDGKRSECAEILATLDVYRTQRLAEVTQREKYAQKKGEPIVEYYQPDHIFCDESEYSQPPRWHGHMPWWTFWITFLNWCQKHRVSDGHRIVLLRQALGGPVKNKPTKVLGPGTWIYEHAVGNLHDHCRRLIIGPDHVTPADFVQGPLRVKTKNKSRMKKRRIRQRQAQAKDPEVVYATG